MVPKLGKMPPFRKRGTSVFDVPTHGEFSHRVGLGSSVPSEGCSGLGMTPWSLTSRGVNSLSDPISTLRGWLEASVDTEPFSRLFPLATLQVDWFSGSVRVGLGSRKDALPGDLAGGRCPRPARVPAVQPSGHTLGAETQCCAPLTLSFARGSRAGGCPEAAQGRAGTGAREGGGVT